MFEYVVVLDDNSFMNIIAKNIAGVLTYFDEDDVNITSIFRNKAVVYEPDPTVPVNPPENNGETEEPGDIVPGESDEEDLPSELPPDATT